MTTPHRPLTIEERFFGHTTIVNVPISVPVKDLPEISLAPVDISPPAPDVTLSNLNEPATIDKPATFLANHWGKILTGVIITGALIWYYNYHNKKSNENKAANVLN